MKLLYRAFYILLICLSFSLQSVAQDTTMGAYQGKPNKDYFVSYWTAAKKTATFPVRWNKKQWIAFGGVVAGATVLYIFDNNIRNFFQAHRSPGLDNVSKYGFEPWGSGLYTVPFVAGFYLVGVASHNQRTRQVAMAVTQAVILGGISVQIVKHIFGRHRPYQDVPPDPRKWQGPNLQYLSFPSGHTTIAFAAATVFASAYSNKPWVAVLSYGIATGVGISRIYDDKHWASDVFIGAALGFGIGKTVYHIMEGNKNFTLGVSNQGGIALAYHF